jgi:hypothetical protein
MPENNVTNNGEEKLLKNNDRSKGPGPDEISTRILKEISPELSPFLTSNSPSKHVVLRKYLKFQPIISGSSTQSYLLSEYNENRKQCQG